MAASNKLTPIQNEFVRVLFGKAMGNAKVACEEVTGSTDCSSIMTSELVEAIKLRADQELALSVPRAVHVIQQMLHGEGQDIFVSDKLHKVCTDILDRAGISKQERPSSAGTTIGLVFLPDKKMLPEPPHEALTLEHTEAV